MKKIIIFAMFIAILLNFCNIVSADTSSALDYTFSDYFNVTSDTGVLTYDIYRPFGESEIEKINFNVLTLSPEVVTLTFTYTGLSRLYYADHLVYWEVGKEYYYLDFSDLYRGDYIISLDQQLTVTFSSSPGVNVVDPTFGKTANPGMFVAKKNINDEIRGSRQRYTTGSAEGVATRIYGRLHCIPIYPFRVATYDIRYALYYNETNYFDLLAVTNELRDSVLGLPPSNGYWLNLAIPSGQQPLIYRNKYYYLTAWGEIVTNLNTLSIVRYMVGTGAYNKTLEYDGNYPDPLQHQTNNNDGCWMYCQYVEYHNWTISNEQPTNQTSSIDNPINTTIDVNYITFHHRHINLTFQTNYSGSWVTYGQIEIHSNGTYGFENSDFTDGNYYWRVLVDDTVKDSYYIYNFTVDEIDVLLAGTIELSEETIIFIVWFILITLIINAKDRGVKVLISIVFIPFSLMIFNSYALFHIPLFLIISFVISACGFYLAVGGDKDKS